jgi:nicotinamide mononucleotide transporter
MSDLEMVAALVGVINIILIVRRSVWNYPFGIATVTLYFYILRDQKLYSLAGLQIFFIAINIYGWWSWYRNKAEVGEIHVRNLPANGLAAWIAGSAIATLAWGMVMNQLSDASYPFWDAAAAMLSVAAQILMTRRFVENWHWWIAVNVISIPLYAVQGLYPTTALFALNLVLAIVGLAEWRKAATP